MRPSGHAKVVVAILGFPQIRPEDVRQRGGRTAAKLQKAKGKTGREHGNEPKFCWRLKASPAAGTLIAAKNEVADVTAVALDGKSVPDDLRFPGFCFGSNATTYLGDL